MLKMVLTGILSCSKRICAAAVTFVVRSVNFVVRAAGAILKEGVSLCSSLKKKLAPPTKEKLNSSSIMEQVKAHTKLAMLQRLFMFIGGFICIFILPEESRGDLTWFERMLTSSKDFLTNAGKSMLNSITTKSINWLTAKAGDAILRC